MRIAVMASGTGTTFEFLWQCSEEGALDTDQENEIVLLICNNPDAMVIERARINGVPVEIVNHREYESREKFDADIAATLVNHDIDVVVMAGWMRIASPILIKVFRDRILNIHPSLLPAFKGYDAPQQAIDAGVLWTGCTAHIVTEEVDAGRIIAQEPVQVYGNDTAHSLHSRIKEYEGALLQEALLTLIEELEYKETNNV